MKPQAYSYVRMSTAEQLDGDSMRRQVKLSDDYARDHGLDLVAENRMQDIGRSAFSGEHISHGVFGVFLKRVKAGEIPSGSYLLVESLDRVSRLNMIDALSLFIDIIKSGIVLVTLIDKVEYRRESFDQLRLFMSVMQLGRANEESETKRKRGKQAWGAKRALLAQTAAGQPSVHSAGAPPKPYTSKCPAWLQPDAMKVFKPIPDRAKIVADIFKWAIDGQGAFTITRRLNGSKTPTFGKSPGWHRSYVTKILTNRAVYGEFQPHQMQNRRRIPDGLPISGYFPAVVSKDDFLSAQSGRSERAKGGRGRKGATYSNLFSGLARCAYCGCTIRYLDKGSSPKGGRYLQCAGALEGRGCQSRVWRYADFETSFFSFVGEIDLKRLVSAASSQNKKQQLLQERKRQTDFRAGLIEEQAAAWSLRDKGAITFLEKRLNDLQIEIKARDRSIQALDEELALDELPSPQIDPEDVRQALFAAMSGDGEERLERRFKIASEIRRLVARLELGSSGRMYDLLWTLDNWKPEKEGDAPPDVRQAILDTLGDQPDQTSPFFRITLKDGTHREVVVDAAQPHRLLMNWELDKKTRDTFGAAAMA